jgi:hypothetical protein
MGRIYKFTFFISLVLLLSNACGYLDNDGVKSEKCIVGNINLIQYEDSDQIALALKETNQSFAIVVGDCRSVYYDSVVNRIYVESPITDSINSYYSIILKDPSSSHVWEALEKHEVIATTFKKKTEKKSIIPIKLKW